jgi:polyisoprenoid-binding protein YceI
MKKFFLIAFTFVCLFTNAQNKEWKVASSSIKFKIKNAGFNVEGSFSGLDAKIIFDNNKIIGNSMEASLNAASINTNNGSRDGHLKKAEYFDVVTFPKLTMAATLFGKEKDGNWRGYFKLTIKNKTKEIAVPFTFIEKDGKASIKGSFTINRLDFGVGESSLILSDYATINIEVIVN